MERSTNIKHSYKGEQLFRANGINIWIKLLEGYALKWRFLNKVLRMFEYRISCHFIFSENLSNKNEMVFWKHFYWSLEENPKWNQRSFSSPVGNRTQTCVEIVNLDRTWLLHWVLQQSKMSFSWHCWNIAVAVIASCARH